MNIIEFLNNNAGLITLTIAMSTGCFAFIKWLDARNRELKNERYEQYLGHISTISGSNSINSSSSPSMPDQIASIWLLLEYKEYYSTTLKIFDNPDLEKISNKPWKQFVLPHLQKALAEIKSEI